MKQNHGFTLLEVLIAVVVLGVGLLGLANLQTAGLQNTHSANLRTVATQLAYEMTDRIRANKTGFTAGDYNMPTLSSSTDCAATNCTASEMAQFDITQWNSLLASNLVNGQGVICRDTTPNDGTDADNSKTIETSEYSCDNIASVAMGRDIYAVKIWWQDERAAGNPIKRFVVPFVP